MIRFEVLQKKSKVEIVEAGSMNELLSTIANCKGVSQSAFRLHFQSPDGSLSEPLTSEDDFEYVEMLIEYHNISGSATIRMELLKDAREDSVLLDESIRIIHSAAVVRNVNA